MASLFLLAAHLGRLRGTLAEAHARELTAALGRVPAPLEFNTIAVSDGVSMGTEGMRCSLVSREVIADSIELVARGHLFDGLV